MNARIAHPLNITGSGEWFQDRLTEARGVLADITHHPASLVILAARVVVGKTDNASECADALDLLRLLDRRPLNTIKAAACTKKGAA